MELPEAVPTARLKWLALGAVVVLLGIVLRVGWVTEDAYITLRTVDNFVHGHGLRWNIDERVQSFTHPLWMFLLSAFYVFTREAFVTTILIGLFTTAAAVLTLVHYARTAGHAVVAVVLLTLSHGFIEFSTSGLENPLSHLLIATFVGLYATRETSLWKLALVAALVAGNRVDALLVVAPALAHASWLELRATGAKQTLRALALGFSPFLAWELFSVFYYGFPFPNTAYAKLNTGLPRLQVIRQGLVYWANGLSWDPPLHLVALAGVATTLFRRRPRDLLIALGLLLYTAYVINIGGDFMQGRFWTIPFFTGVCLIAISELPLENPGRAASLVVPFGLLLMHPLAKEAYTLDWYYNGIADERSQYRNELSFVLMTRTSPAPLHRWSALGLDLRSRKEKVAVYENVGLLGYHAGPTVHVIDPLALTDPLLARLPMRYSASWRVGHYLRQVPSGYPETVLRADGSCVMRDKRLCEYYAHLHEVIAGPLFSFDRLKTVVAMNFGVYNSLIDRDRYRYPAVSHATLEELTDPIKEQAAWDSSGTVQLPDSGITIDLLKRYHAARMEISFDGNDGYLIKFRQGETIVAELTTQALDRGFMHSRTIEVPEPARTQGFDILQVIPQGGDGMYSLGFIRMHDDSALPAGN